MARKRRKKVKIKRILLFLLLLILLPIVITSVYNYFNESNDNIDESEEDNVLEYNASLVMVGDALIHPSLYNDANKLSGYNGYNFKPQIEFIKEEVDLFIKIDEYDNYWSKLDEILDLKNKTFCNDFIYTIFTINISTNFHTTLWTNCFSAKCTICHGFSIWVIMTFHINTSSLSLFIIL